MDTLKFELDLNVQQSFYIASLLLGMFLNPDEEVEVRKHTMEQYLNIYMVLPDRLKEELNANEKKFNEDKQGMIDNCQDMLDEVRRKYLDGK